MGDDAMGDALGPPLAQQKVEGLGLPHRAREPVEHEARRAVLFRDAVRDHRHHQRVLHELAALQSLRDPLHAINTISTAAVAVSSSVSVSVSVAASSTLTAPLLLRRASVVADAADDDLPSTPEGAAHPAASVVGGARPEADRAFPAAVLAALRASDSSDSCSTVAVAA